MRKHIWIALLTVVLLAGPLWSCFIEFEPDAVTVKQGEEFTITLVIEHEHRRCELTLDDTEYEVKGLEIVKKGEWKSEDRSLHRQMLTLKLVADKGTLRVVRECTRKGISQGILKVTAKK